MTGANKSHQPNTWLSIWRVLIISLLLFVACNAVFAALNPLEALGRLSLYNVVLPGRERLQLTGHLGDVMKESVQTALSCVRSLSENLGIDPSLFQKSDFHVHVPSGAVPKDGPSAGITIATALVSLLTGRPVRPKISMTGEITLRGVVLPIGGLKEKCLAALRYGFREVIIPQDNEKDLVDLPKELKNHLRFHFVERVDQVFEIAFPVKKMRGKQPTTQ